MGSIHLIALGEVAWRGFAFPYSSSHVSSLQKESAPRRTDLRGADHKGSITEEAYSVTGKRKGLPALSTKVAPWRLGKWCAPADQSQI